MLLYSTRAFLRENWISFRGTYAAFGRDRRKSVYILLRFGTYGCKTQIWLPIPPGYLKSNATSHTKFA